MQQSQAEAIPAPNIWHHEDVYEIENRGVDPDGAIWSAMRTVARWDQARVLDLGCGTGFHLPLFTSAREVIGVEPHPRLAARAAQRIAHLAPRVQVLQGTAQRVPVADGSIDVIHARWAYFFGPGCEPGLAEVQRVLAPGGTAFIIDHDASRSTFGAWFRRAWPEHDPAALARFWQRHGWSRTPVDMRWEFESRTDFESVVRIEFPEHIAAEILAEHAGTAVDYAVNLWHWRQPEGFGQDSSTD